jgi:large subunit ribosomal protein L3
MGNETVVKKNIRVVDIRSEDNIIILKGPVPGAKNGLLKIFSK